GISEYDHPLAVIFIFVGYEASFTDVQGPEVLIRGPHSNDTAIRRIELADLGNRPPQLWADILDKVTLGPDETGVVDRETDLSSGRESTDLRTGSSAPYDYQVLPQSLHVLLLISAKTPAKSHQDDYRRNTPGDAEHGEETAHLVCAEGAECLSQNFGEIHRHLKTGGQSFKRIAGRAGELSCRGQSRRPTSTLRFTQATPTGVSLSQACEPDICGLTAERPGRLP